MYELLRTERQPALLAASCFILYRNKLLSVEVGVCTLFEFLVLWNGMLLQSVALYVHSSGLLLSSKVLFSKKESSNVFPYLVFMLKLKHLKLKAFQIILIKTE